MLFRSGILERVLPGGEAPLLPLTVRNVEPLLPEARRPKHDPKFAVLQEMLQEWMLLRDPPHHTHLRAPVS